MLFFGKDKKKQNSNQTIENDILNDLKQLSIKTDSLTAIIKNRVWTISNEKKECFVVVKGNPNSIELFHSINHICIPQFVMSLGKDHNYCLLKSRSSFRCSLEDCIQNDYKLALFFIQELSKTLLNFEKIDIILADINPKLLFLSPENELQIIYPFKYQKTGEISSEFFQTEYSAPEVINRSELSKRTPQYSLGVMIKNAFEQNKVTKGKQNQEKLEKTPYLSQLLVHLLKENPEDRFQSMQNVVDLMEDYLETLKKDKIIVEYSQKSTIGINPHRLKNEDSIAVFKYEGLFNSHTKEFFLFLLADGMGGGVLGEVASKTAIEEMAKSFFENLLTNSSIEDPLNLLNHAIFEADKAIKKKKELLKPKSKNLMGTTLSSVLLIDDTIYIGHVGDSRIYLITKEGIHQLSHDHSYVQLLVDTGEISKEEARQREDKNQITKCLGMDNFQKEDIYNLEKNPMFLKRESYILICSDGLWEAFSDQEINRTIKSYVKNNYSTNRICDFLTGQAVDNSGKDNISVILIHIKPQS